MSRFWVLLLACLLCAGILTACFNKTEERISGELVSFEIGEDGRLVSFVLRLPDGKESEIAVMEYCRIRSNIESVSEEDFLQRPQLGLAISVTSLRDRMGQEIQITGALERNAAVLSDGTPLDIMRRWDGDRTYRLADGTELLEVWEDSGPEHCYVGGIESFDDLSEAAKEKVLAYYEAQGTLYDEKAELERAYAAWREEGNEYYCRSLDQRSSPTASNGRMMYFLTTVRLPVEGRTFHELRLGAAFDRETGDHINNLDLFACPEEEVIEAVLDAGKVPTQLLKTEMRAAFRPEYLVFFPDSVGINFPQGTLPSQEYDYYVSAEYDDGLSDLLQDWAVPEEVRERP